MLMLALVLVMMTVVITAQSLGKPQAEPTIESAREHFKNHETQIELLTQLRQQSMSTADLPGATTIFGLQISGGQSVEAGDEVRVNAYAFADFAKSVIIVGRMKNPGDDGTPERGDDAYHYFLPKMGSFGFMSQVRVEAYFRDLYKFRTGRNQGRGLVELLVIDATTGQLAQHTFINFYVDAIGPQGQIFGSVRRVEVVDGTVIVYGTFAPNQPYYVWQGEKNLTYDGTAYPVYSHDGGKTLQLPQIRTKFGWEYKADVWVLDPDFQVAFGLPKAYTIPAYIR